MYDIQLTIKIRIKKKKYVLKTRKNMPLTSKNTKIIILCATNFGNFISNVKNCILPA